MKDDRFTNLEKDIIRTVGRVLSSQEISDLKHSIYSAMDQVEKATRKTAEKLQDLGEEKPKKQTYQQYDHCCLNLSSNLFHLFRQLDPILDR